MKILSSFRLWALALVVLGVFALVNTPSAPSSLSRIAHLESLVKCPPCEDLSVAQSNATSAVAVRNEIAAKVRAGESDNQILTSLEDVYGTSILLSPSTSGIGALLWLGPLLVLVVVVAIGVRLARRRR
ncbi:MAG: cytochrome c-type biogenesis protein [Acidimicrobiales bacterium]